MKVLVGVHMVVGGWLLVLKLGELGVVDDGSNLHRRKFMERIKQCSVQQTGGLKAMLSNAGLDNSSFWREFCGFGMKFLNSNRSLILLGVIQGISNKQIDDAF